MLADPREARALRSLRPRRASAAPARRRLRPDDLRRLRGHLRRPRRRLRLRRHLRRPAAARRPAARRRSALRPRDLVRGIGHRHRDDDPDSARGDLRDLQGLRRGGRQRSRKPARSARAPASCATSRASSRSRGPCATLPRHRQDDRQAVPDLPRRRPRRPRAQADGRRFPPGIATGQRLRLYGEGEHGSAGGPPGDLYVVVHVQEHYVLPSRGRRSLLRAADQLPDAGARRQRSRCRRSTGDEQVKIPAGTQPGARFKLRGKGMPNVSGRGQGDLYVDRARRRPEEADQGTEAPARGAGARRMPQEKLETSDADGGEKPFFETVKDIFG